MLSRSQMFRRVTIVGVGLMGGSLGLAIKKYSLAQEVVGLSQKHSSLMAAMKLSAIDIAQSDVKEAIRHADLVVLASPVNSILKLLPVINPYLKRGCIVTDIGSAKAEIVEASEKVLSNPSFFIGSHPLVGSEKKGVENSKAELFENAQCIMTPTLKTNSMVKEKIKFFWTKLGAKVNFLAPEEHDQILSYISHLPHLLAYGLMEITPTEHLPYATQNFKDTTRVASSSPQMWGEICTANAKNVIKTIDELAQSLSHLRKAIINRDQNILVQNFSKAKEKRDAIPPA